MKLLPKLGSSFFHPVWNVLACYNLFDNINLIGKNLGFYKLLAWHISEISSVTVYFLICFGDRFTRARSMQPLEDYRLWKY